MDHGELPPGARALLDAARDADDPTAADRARIDAALSTRLRALGVAAPMALAKVTPIVEATRTATLESTATSAAPASGGLGLSSKLALALVGAGIVAGGLTQLPHAARAPASEARPSARVARPNAAPAAPPSPSVAAPRMATPEALVAPEPARAQPQRAARTNARSARPARRPHDSTPVVAAAPELSADSLRDEVALLEAANDALQRQRYADALRALDQHERRFTAGALREERMGLRVLALCGLGDYGAGDAARLRFLRDAPHSVLARKVTAACTRDAVIEPGGDHDRTD